MSDIFMQAGTISDDAGSAEDMIRANGAAEAREADALRDQVSAYAHQLNELREICSRNSAAVEQMRRTNEETVARVNSALQELKDLMGKVQAELGSREQESTEKEDIAKEILDAVNETKERTADLIQQSDEFAHKENVRVYRNIQAATDQLLQKQTKDLKDELASLKGASAAKPKKSGVQAATLVFAIMTFVFVVCDSFGIVAYLLRMITG
ncbi:MAG: hypothetical protein PUC46_09395 [Lachnospiraceae bacterium]|jgi:sugar-specific transcriptional regulator TrmB|nr:hypothetical protein [Lachnospiraceae bacterium]